MPRVSTADDTVEIYRNFLDAWTEKKGTLNVSEKAPAPTSDDLEQFSDCAQENGRRPRRWLPTKARGDIGSYVGSLSYVRMVDPETWKAVDPAELIAQGQTVESAVGSGFDRGLLTVSAITFDEAHETAAFTYSFVCGELCGSGAVVVFRKTQAGWVRSDNSCRHWVA